MTGRAEPAGDAPLLTLAVRIVERGVVDWDDVRGSAQPEDADDVRAVLRGLRLLDVIISGHDTLRASSPTGAVAAAGADVRWGPLIVREKIGSGSSGTVYRAWDPRLARDVALKLIDDDQAEPDAVVAEARALARVQHPNVSVVHGAERIDGRIGIWMEFVEGRSLADEIADRGRLSPDEAAVVGLDVCRALAAVHAAGLLHRDVKAQNVVRAVSGRVVLSDFGATLDANDTHDSGGHLVGTPLYLAPELFGGAVPSVQSDLYSLGVLLYFLLTGGFPVSGRASADIRQAHAAGQRVPLRSVRADVPASLTRLVERLLEAAPSKRFRTADAAGRELAAWLRARSQPWARRHAIRLAGAAVLLMLATTAWIGVPGVWPGMRTDGVTPMPGPSARLLKEAPCQGTPTADGEWVACIVAEVDSHTGRRAQRLVLFGINTGETREVWRTAETDRPLRSSTISPDGRHIAVAVPTPSSNGQPRELRVFEIAARRWRTIATLPEDTFSLSVGAWSRHDDRLEVYVLRRGMSSFAFALVSPGTGAIDIAFEFPVMPTNWGRSADGRWLTYGGPDREIRVCDLRTGDARSRPCAVIAAHPATDFLSFFTPDGSLLFSSDRGGTIGLWRVGMDGLTQRGTPTLIRDTGRERLVPVAFSEAGDLFYRLEVGAPDVLQVDLRADAAQVRGSMAPPIRVSRAPAWSSDGARFAYVAGLGNHTGGSSVQLVVQSLSAKTERTFDLAGVRFNSVRTAWAPGSRRLAVRAVRITDTGGEVGVDLVDPERGPVGTPLRRLAPREASVQEQVGDIGWLSATTLVFSKASGVGTFDVANGQEGSLWDAAPSERVMNLAVSPDRSWLALTIQGVDGRPRLRLVQARPSRHRPRVHHDATGWVQCWPSDSEILVTRPEKTPPAGGVAELWRVPVDGTEPTRVPVAAQGLYEVRAHPDGHRLAISTHALRSEFFVGLGR